jgi:hypothetical protein
MGRARRLRVARRLAFAAPSSSRDGQTSFSSGRRLASFRDPGRVVSLDHSEAVRAWLLIVLVSVFDFHVRFRRGEGCAAGPVCPAPTAPGWPPSASLGWFVLVTRALAGRRSAASR